MSALYRCSASAFPGHIANEGETRISATITHKFSQLGNDTAGAREFLPRKKFCGRATPVTLKNWSEPADIVTEGENAMRTRFWMLASLTLILLAPMASARSRKPHPAGTHPKPNHPVSKYKHKKPKKFKH
jgi:hypothetical protein